MMRIIKESLQDVSNYLRSTDLKDEVLNEYPEWRNNPTSVSDDINFYILDLVKERFPDETTHPDVILTTVFKVYGEESEVISTDHLVVKFNGTYYDYTAHEFNDSFDNKLSFEVVPVTQSTITSNRQINSGVSSVKYYALLEQR